MAKSGFSKLLEDEDMVNLLDILLTKEFVVATPDVWARQASIPISKTRKMLEKLEELDIVRDYNTKEQEQDEMFLHEEVSNDVLEEENYQSKLYGIYQDSERARTLLNTHSKMLNIGYD